MKLGKTHQYVGRGAGAGFSRQADLVGVGRVLEGLVWTLRVGV